MRHTVLRILAVFGLVSALPVCATPLTYSAEPIEAWVIDTETKKPLEGVVITANWQLEQGTMGGNIQVGQLVVMEAVTDKDGRFSFPAWGPKTTWQSFLVNDDPQLLFFKSGYEYRRLNNPYSSNRELRLRPDRRSNWNGKTIEMKLFKGTAQEYARHLGSINNDLYALLGSETCDWKKIPKLLLALTEQSRAFRKHGIDSLYDVDLYLPVREGKCGSPKAFFEAFRP